LINGACQGIEVLLYPQNKYRNSALFTSNLQKLSWINFKKNTACFQEKNLLDYYQKGQFREVYIELVIKTLEFTIFLVAKNKGI